MRVQLHGTAPRLDRLGVPLEVAENLRQHPLPHGPVGVELHRTRQGPQGPLGLVALPQGIAQHDVGDRIVRRQGDGPLGGLPRLLRPTGGEVQARPEQVQPCLLRRLRRGAGQLGCGVVHSPQAQQFLHARDAHLQQGVHSSFFPFMYVRRSPYSPDGSP